MRSILSGHLHGKFERKALDGVSEMLLSIPYILVLCSLVIPTETIPKQQIFAGKFEGKFGKSEFSLEISERIIGQSEFSLENSRQLQQ